MRIKNVDDIRESPSVEIMQLMKNDGAEVEYSDIYLPIFPKMRRYSFDLKSISIDAETIQKYDCIVVGTNHDNFDYPLISNNAKLIIDSRGVYRGRHDNVVHA